MGTLTKILDRFTGSVIFEAEVEGETASIRLGLAAKLAYQKKADLRGADLYEANLCGADLYEANLCGADLYGAKGINKYLTTPLYTLLDQPGPIRAYKLVTSTNTGPHYPSITYLVGQKYEVADANCDEHQDCAPGISLATLDWCMKQWQPGYKILIAEFRAADIAAIPIASDGKFRVFRCEIVGEKNLEELGLAGKPETVPA